MPRGRKPEGEQAFTQAERHARRRAHAEPGTMAYASKLINDFESMLDEVLSILGSEDREGSLPEVAKLKERAEARRRHILKRGKPHLADPP